MSEFCRDAGSDAHLDSVHVEQVSAKFVQRAT